MKPIIALLLLFSLPLLISCQKELQYFTDLPADSTGTDTGTGVPIDTTAVLTGNTNAYYDVTINGIHYAQDVTETNGYEAGSGMGGQDEVIFGGGISAESPETNPDKKGFDIEKGTFYNYLTATEEDFNGFFLPGNYMYSAGALNGVDISWSDKDGKEWGTGRGSRDQSGSSFKIVSVVTAPSLAGHYIKVKATFNCKLYDDAGNSLTLTKGSAVVVFGML